MTAHLRISAVLFACGSLAACADMPMQVSAPPPVAVPQMRPAPAGPNQVQGFLADQRAEARRLEATGQPADARLRWRYVAALAPNDAEARGEIARLDTVIRTRVDALIAQGEAAVMRNRLPDAQVAFLKALAMDGGNERARTRLRELDTRAAFVAQDRKDQRARAAARNAGSESAADE
jgi:hypothetical protein